MLAINKILFPTDYSACAEQAFSQAAYLAEQYDAEIHVLHVAEPSTVLPPLNLTEADVAEAIDFVDYYARQAIRLAGPVEVTHFDGEENESHLIPMGAGVAIPPWNFPLAIFTGCARYYAYSAIMLFAGAATALMHLEPGPPMLASGALITVAGLAILVRFLKSHPAGESTVV